MIFIYFLLICGWGYGISRFLLRTKDNRFFLYYPLGLAAVGLLVSFLWFLDVPFFQLNLVVQAVGWTLLPLLLSDIWLRAKKRKWNQKKWILSEVNKLLQKTYSFYDLPWLILFVLTIFSAFVMTLWMWNVRPVHWDNISLYDFRAQQIVSGWQRMDFLENASSHPNLKMYDWQHPWFASFVLALGYSFGISNPLILFWFLIASLVWHAVSTWKSWQIRMMFLSGLFLMPSLFIAFTEAYGVLLATMFWGHFFLLTRKVKDIEWKDVAYLVLLSGGAMYSRMVEPFWGVFGLLFLWQHRKSISRSIVVFLAMLGWYAHWSFFVRLAQNYFTLQAADLDPIQGFLKFDPQGFLLSSYINLVTTFISSTAVHLGITIFILWFFVRNKVSTWWSTQAFALFGSLGILFGGMALFALPGTGDWSEIKQALPRASMPLSMLGLILLCDLYQQWRDSTRMK